MNNAFNSGLINAIKSGNLEDVLWRVQKMKSCINADSLGWRPLHWAAHCGVLHSEGTPEGTPEGIVISRLLRDDTRIVEALLNHGACPHAKNWKGKLPVDIAKAKGFSKIVCVLEAAMLKARPPQN